LADGVAATAKLNNMTPTKTLTTNRFFMAHLLVWGLHARCSPLLTASVQYCRMTSGYSQRLYGCGAKLQMSENILP
ncbi:MAG: hypothetical protein AABZ10_12650, partial [Nitrospirota bacterium]